MVAGATTVFFVRGPYSDIEENEQRIHEEAEASGDKAAADRTFGPYQDAVARYNRLSDISLGLFIGGGVATIAGIVWLLWPEGSSSEAEETTAQWLLLPTAQGVAVGLGWTW